MLRIWEVVRVSYTCAIIALHGSSFSPAAEAVQSHFALGLINAGCTYSKSHIAGVCLSRSYEFWESWKVRVHVLSFKNSTAK